MEHGTAWLRPASFDLLRTLLMVTMLVRDFLDLPEESTADDFIVRPQSTAQELARSYALTSAVRPRLDTLLREIGGAIERNEDLGRFIFGSFGSGKSHFLRVAAMMLANDHRLYDNARDPGLLALRNAHPFLETANLLVVETSMVGVNEEVSAFTRQLADSFDRTLEGLGKPPLRAFGTRAVFDEFDRLCERVPEMFDRFAMASGYDRAFYEAKRAEAHSGKDVAAFARDVAQFFAGDERSFVPTESEAREQMAAHAQSLGFRGVVFAIDEFILWAQGLSGVGYVGAVNALNALVESADVKPVRFIVLAAIQRSIMSVFPDDVSEKVLREQLARVKDRFPEIYLEDSNLFEIAQKRVLNPKVGQAEAWRREVAAVTRDLAQSGRSVLLGDEPATSLEQLYPFHPALLRVLSDVSQGLHRARSSLFMLFQLLTEVRPELQIGELVSLGALWEVLFSPDHIQNLENYAPRHDPNHRANLLLKTHGTWERLRTSIAAASGGEANEKILDLAVKSALLAQLSHSGFLEGGLRGLDRAVTIENLLRLNRADIAAMNEKVGALKVEELIKKLAAAEPGTVMLEGQGPAAIVRIELNAIDLSELLVALRPPSPFSTLLAQVKLALGFGAGFTTGQEGKLTAPFRGTERSGRVRFENFGQFSVGGRGSTLALEANDEFKLAILIESEMAGNAQQTIDNARAKIESARDQTQAWSAAWIPGPLSTDGREALDTLAKAELFEGNANDYLDRFRAADHALVRQRMGAMKLHSQATLRRALQKAFGEAGRVHTMRKEPPELFAAPNSDVENRAKLYATQLLERRYQQHPKFAAAPAPSALSRLLAIDRRLLANRGNNLLSAEEAEVTKKLGEPLDLFEPGSGVANIKNGGHYLERLRSWVQGGERIVGRLMSLLADEPMGLQRSPAQLLIAVLANRDGYRLVVDGHPVSVNAVGDVDPRAALERGTLVQLDVWNKARRAASFLFSVADVSAAHNIGSSDALIAALREPIARNRELLASCAASFDALAVRKIFTGRSVVAERYRAASRQLAALDDETVLERLAVIDLTPYRDILRAAAADGPALNDLSQYDSLDDVAAASSLLSERIARALTNDIPSVAPEIQRWMKEARAFVADSLRRSAPGSAGPGVDAPPPNSQGAPETPATSSDEIVAEGRLEQRATDADVDAVVATIRAALVNRLRTEGGPIELELRLRVPGIKAP